MRRNALLIAMLCVGALGGGGCTSVRAVVVAPLLGDHAVYHLRMFSAHTQDVPAGRPEVVARVRLDMAEVERLADGSADLVLSGERVRLVAPGEREAHQLAWGADGWQIFQVLFAAHFITEPLDELPRVLAGRIRSGDASFLEIAFARRLMDRQSHELRGVHYPATLLWIRYELNAQGWRGLRTALDAIPEPGRYD